MSSLDIPYGTIFKRPNIVCRDMQFKMFVRNRSKNFSNIHFILDEQWQAGPPGYWEIS